MPKVKIQMQFDMINECLRKLGVVKVFYLVLKLKGESKIFSKKWVI